MKSSSIAKNTVAGITLVAVLFGSGLQVVFADPATILIPSNFTFNSNLALGSNKSPDVSYLQRFLNYDVRTRLADPDPCVATPIVNQFDARTRDAVIKFQNLYKSETLTPAALTVGTGNVGIYTRNKINQLLRTPEYAQIIGAPTASTSAITTQYSQETAVVNYYNDVLQALSKPSSPSASTQTSVSAPVSATTAGALSSDPVVSSYFNYLNTVTSPTYKPATSTSAANNSAANAQTYVTQTPTSSTTLNNIIATQSVSTNPVIADYFTYLNKTLATVPAAQAAAQATVNASRGQSIFASSSLPTNSNNQAINEYYALVNKTVNTNLPTTGLNGQQVSATATKPIITNLTPEILTNCLITITIIGRNFDPSENFLVGTLGYMKASSTPYGAATGAVSDLRAITFNIRQFSDYNAIQSLYAGTTQAITIRVQNSVTGKISEEAAIVRYTFPGIRNTILWPTVDQYGIPYEIPATGATGSASGGTSAQTGANSGNTNGGVKSEVTPTGILKTVETTDKKLFGYTPQGKVLKLIGGDRAVDSFYGMTPNGHLNQKLQGNTPGMVSVTGKSGSGGRSGSGGSGGNSSSGSNTGAAVGILGAAFAASALSSGGSSGAAGGAAAGAGSTGVSVSATQNFGGRITSTYQCVCQYAPINTLVTIQDARGYSIQLMLQPGISRVYAYSNVNAGVNTLGTYISGGQCLVNSGYVCTTVGAPTGTITQIGTSKGAGL